MLKKFLQEIKAKYWYTMFEYGNVRLNAMTLRGFLRRVMRKDEINLPSEWSNEKDQLLHQVRATAKINL
jgi:hypothetical protein